MSDQEEVQDIVPTELEKERADQESETPQLNSKNEEEPEGSSNNPEPVNGENKTTESEQQLEGPVEEQNEIEISNNGYHTQTELNQLEQPERSSNDLSPVAESTVAEAEDAVDSPQIPSILSTQESAPTSTTSIPEDAVNNEESDLNSDAPLALTSSSHTRQISAVSMSSANATLDNSKIFKNTFELILASKEAKKSPEFKSVIQKALDSLDDVDSRDAYVIFSALKACCETSSTDVKSKAVDLFAKLFDYAQFEDSSDKAKLTDDSVEVISGCFEGEGTDPELELQVVRALMHSILLMPCHGASLLKAVRQIYNVFIFSLSARNQAVAQGILTQVIGSIFQRVESMKRKRNKSNSVARLSMVSFSKEELDLPNDSINVSEEKLTLLRLENMNDSRFDSDRVKEANMATDSDEDLAVKDAFLVFRAMCKLSVKSLDSNVIDMRSHSVRSKLLSLHIIHTILKEHIEVFLSHEVVILSSNSNEEIRLINAVRQYVNLALSKNAASPLAPVFELTLEIFWLIISNLRSEFKREIPVFWDEIYFPVAEMKTSSAHQKRYLLSVIERLCNDSRCIIEFYLNYDCDSTMPNICEKVIDYLTKLSLLRVDVTPQQKQAFRDNRRNGISVYDISKISNLTSSTMSSKPPEPEIYNLFPLEYALKMTSIGCSVAFLRSLYSWAQKDLSNSHTQTRNLPGLSSHNGSALSLPRNRSDSNNTSLSNSRNQSFVNNLGDSLTESDDPGQFESQKQRKKAFLEGVRQFNQKAKKGLKYFLANGFLSSEEPREIATFLLHTDGLDKQVIGEYLGEGDEHNIAIMHAFVDELEFSNTDFVDAMRVFLQSFRLPGEAQKIDRFMLKFAERYVLGNPLVFSNADAAYVLAYSVIMLNTDLHSPQIKNRMTFENFVINNGGIDDGKDLPREFLEKIYNEILENEIKLQSEQHAALIAGDVKVMRPTQSISFFGGRDVYREAYIHASNEMSTKTEKLVRNLGKKIKSDDYDGIFYVASSVLHVKSIFDTLWMSILAALTPPFKEYDEEEVNQLCLEGIKLAIRIACMFRIDYARTSFVRALVQFQNLNNFEEMKKKNVDAIYIMLELAVLEGDNLGESWLEILFSTSQLERLQLIAQGVDQGSIPDVSTAKLVNRHSIESNVRTSTSFFSSFASQTPSQTALSKFQNQHLSPEVAQLLVKTDLAVAIDRIYTNSANLSGESIVHFVRALSEVAQEEIDSSGQSTNPRTYSLQKVVDICYYNMNRIRLEWSHLWAIMGETFNVVGCHTNPAILFFALDSLRQLSMRFLEIEELAHFKFQKEFLKPFEYVVIHNDSLEVKDMVLECINNMILARADKIKSGWKTIFAVCTATAKQNKESLVMKAYKMANWINKEYIEEVKQQESFSGLVECFTELTKNEKFQRISLLSLDVILRLIHEIAQLSLLNDTTESSKDDSPEAKHARNEHLVKLWFPVLFAFHDIIMNGEELEVRSRALNGMFDVLLQYGRYFELEFWDMICEELLFPIFGAISKHWELKLDETDDEFSVWLSTTLIQALKSMISLFTHYFDALSRMLDGYLKLIVSCICQENDTIARIGRDCLATLLIDNAEKFNADHWDLITEAFHDLFELTTATELFTADPLRNQRPESDIGNIGTSQDTTNTSYTEDIEAKQAKSKDKSSIVVKSVLQLLLIQTTSELFENDGFYDSIPYDYLMKMAKLLYGSYEFAKKFNDDYDLRVRLWNSGVIERLPNLLKQESSSAAVFINIMFRTYCDDEKASAANKQEIIDYVEPLCRTIMERYAAFDETTQQRNINTWKPVIVEIYQGYVELDEDDFTKFTPVMFKLTLEMFSKNMTGDLRMAIRSFMARVGEEFIRMPEEKP